MARGLPGATAPGCATREAAGVRQRPEYRHHAAQSAASMPRPLRAKKNALTGAWSINGSHYDGGWWCLTGTATEGKASTSA